MATINDTGGGYALGGYREVGAPAGLCRFVEVAWLHARPLVGGRAIAGLGHRVLPETGASLCFACHRDRDGRPEEPTLTLMGPIHTVRFFRPAPGSHLEAVRLKAEWCRDLLGCDPGEHADGWTALPAASRRRLRGLLDRLAATRSSEAAVQVLLDAIAGLAERCEPGRSTRLAHDALEVVRARPTASADLAERARALGVSSRHLRRAVRATTGRGPKRFHRVRRLQHAVSLAEAGTDRRLGWAGLAVDAGFYDQAHLIQEFRELTGATPLELRSERALQATPSASSSSQPAGW